MPRLTDCRSITGAGLVALALGSGLVLARASAEVTVEPNPLRMGAMYRGGVVHVRGALEPQTDVCVTISGGTIGEKLNRKGRVGPIWATVGSVTVSGVPALHLVACTAPVRQILPAAAIEANLLDLEAVAARATLSVPGDRQLLEREYFKLKESEGVMHATFGTGGAAAAGGPFDLALPWPARAPAGQYTVRVFRIRDRAIVAREDVPFTAELVGLPRLIAHLAFDRGRLYGGMAVLVALAVGLLTGLIFKKGVAH
jgi:hypothetical protein